MFVAVRNNRLAQNHRTIVLDDAAREMRSLGLSSEWEAAGHMNPTFFKGVVLGSVVSMVMLFTTAAFAGSGVGAIFTLGKANSVNATTQLGGSTNGKQLTVVNTNTGANAAGIGIAVHSNKPPLVVNSATKVANLNADLLDGANSSAFQKRIASTCSNGAAISSVGANGTVGCVGPAVIAIHRVLNVSGSAQLTFGDSGLVLDLECDSLSQAGFQFKNTGLKEGIIKMLHFTGSSSELGTQWLTTDTMTGKFVLGSEMAGQYIWTAPVGDPPFVAHYEVTISIHQSNTASACTYDGTADVAYVVTAF